MINIFLSGCKFNFLSGHKFNFLLGYKFNRVKAEASEEGNMKKRGDKQPVDDDAMRPEYDFSGGKRGVTAKRYEQGTNLALIAPEVLDVFPDSETVNETLRALAPIMRRRRSSSS